MPHVDFLKQWTLWNEMDMLLDLGRTDKVSFDVFHDHLLGLAGRTRGRRGADVYVVHRVHDALDDPLKCVGEIGAGAVLLADAEDDGQGVQFELHARPLPRVGPEQKRPMTIQESRETKILIENKNNLFCVRDRIRRTRRHCFKVSTPSLMVK